MPHRDRAAAPAKAIASEVPSPAAEETSSASELPEIISHAEMNTAREQNLAEPLGHVIGYILRYLGSWWIPFEGGWIRADPALTAMLDTEAARMTEQDAIIARNAAIRAAVTSVQVHSDDGEPGIGGPPIARLSGPDRGGSRSSDGVEGPAR